MTDLSTQMLAAPGRERPDYTLFDFPDASLADAATEEIEIDQALSLAGRFGRDFLGVQIGGVIGQFNDEHLTISTADHEQTVDMSLNTRTGAFTLQDPERIWSAVYSAVTTAPTTATSEQLNINMNAIQIGEPFLYVAPRLFWRVVNNGDQTYAIGDFDMRMASISVKLTFRLFIELLERFADVTLL